MTSRYAVCASVPLMTPPAILVVDDDPTFLQVVPSTLMRALPDVTVETYRSARLAASKLAAGHYDAAITDLRMPDLGGFEVLGETLASRPCTPIVLLTGQHDSTLAERAFGQGAFDFIPKPFDRERLVSAVSLGIKAHRLRRRIEERRLHMMQIREVMHRRWEDPLSAKTGEAVNSSRSLMDAAYDRLIASATRTEKLIQRTERVLHRMQRQIHEQALSRVRNQ